MSAINEKINAIQPNMELGINEEGLSDVRTTCTNLMNQMTPLVKNLITLESESNILEFNTKIESVKTSVYEKLSGLTKTSENLTRAIKSLEADNKTFSQTLLLKDQDLSKLKTFMETANKSIDELTTNMNKIRASRNTTLPFGDSTINIASKAPKLKPPVFKAEARDKPMRYI